MSEHLFNEMMKALHYKPFDKRDGLNFFKNKGFFLVDATYKPVNHMKGRERNNTILADFNNLIDDLKKIDPNKKCPLILVKANVCRLLENKFTTEGFIALNKGHVIPFPSTGQQKRFHNEIGKILK